jgi:hypothetical protein
LKEYCIEDLVYESVENHDKSIEKKLIDQQALLTDYIKEIEVL